MSYTFEIREALKDYNNIPFKMIQIRIVDTEGQFIPKGMPISVNVGSVKSLMTIISANRKELIGYFTVDAFTGFSNSETLTFGYRFEIIDSIPNVNVLNPIPLPSVVAGIPYQLATNTWLQSL